MDDNLNKKVEEVNTEELKKKKNRKIALGVIGGCALLGILIAVLYLVSEFSTKEEINIGSLVGTVIGIIICFIIMGLICYFIYFKLTTFLAKKALNAYKTNKEKTEKENFEKAKKIEEERKNSIDADFVLELGKGYYRQGNIITGTRKEVLNRALFMNTSTKFFQILYPDYPGGTQYIGIDVKMTEPLPYKALLKYEKSENIHEVENISGNSLEYKHGVLETGFNTSSYNESRERSVNLDSIKIIIYLKSKEHSVVVFTLKNEQDALRLQVKLEEILKESNKTTN